MPHDRQRPAWAEADSALYCSRSRKLLNAHLDRELFRLAPRNVEKLQVLVGHARAVEGRCYAARRRLTSGGSITAAFGFTTQNLPM